MKDAGKERLHSITKDGVAESGVTLKCLMGALVGLAYTDGRKQQLPELALYQRPCDVTSLVGSTTTTTRFRTRAPTRQAFSMLAKGYFGPPGLQHLVWNGWLYAGG